MFEKQIIKTRREIDEKKVKLFTDMKNVYSISCVVSDAMHRNGTMKSYIKSRAADKKIIGPAITVKLTAGDIVDCLIAFQNAKPGDVIVIDAFGESNTSIWGGLMSGLAKNAGVIGAIIDGSCRDTDEAKMLDFPIYSAFVNPRAAHTAESGRDYPIEINVPIVCGGIIVNPGDIVVADEIGCAVIPYDDIDEVYERAIKQAQNEELSRKDILNGATKDELLKKYGRI